MNKEKLSKTLEVENKEDNYYYNISIVNNDKVSQLAQFQQILTNQIIQNPEDYYISCIRFSLNTTTIPIFLFKDDSYFITMKYNGFRFSAPVVFTGFTVPQLGKPIFSYQAFIDMINDTFITVYNGLAALTTLPVGASQPPYLIYNSQSNLISLYAQDRYDTVVNATDPVEVFCNTILGDFFFSFWYYFFGENTPTKTDLKWIIKNIHNSNTTLDPTVPTGYIKMTQDFSTLFNWPNISSIAFKSNLMNVRPEYITIANSTAFLSNSNSNTAGSGIPSTNQITDFIPSLSAQDPAGWRGGLTYVPSAQYRLLDLLGNNQNAIDITIVWKDNQNNEYTLAIPPGGVANIKLAFIKKSLYKNYKKV